MQWQIDRLFIASKVYIVCERQNMCLDNNKKKSQAHFWSSIN